VSAHRAPHLYSQRASGSRARSPRSAPAASSAQGICKWPLDHSCDLIAPGTARKYAGAMLVLWRVRTKEIQHCRGYIGRDPERVHGLAGRMTRKKRCEPNPVRVESRAELRLGSWVRVPDNRCGFIDQGAATREKVQERGKIFSALGWGPTAKAEIESAEPAELGRPKGHVCTGPEHGREGIEGALDAMLVEIVDLAVESLREPAPFLHPQLCPGLQVRRQDRAGDAARMVISTAPRSRHRLPHRRDDGCEPPSIDANVAVNEGDDLALRLGQAVISRPGCSSPPLGQVLHRASAGVKA
jgi:hypothetical protein